MDHLRNKYNPQFHYDRAIAALDMVSREEALSWYNHHCTQSLLNSLEGDLAGIVITWLGGGYSEDKSSSGTAQKVSKARGMAQALDDILEHIHEIKNLKLEDSLSGITHTYEGLQGPG